MPTMSGVCPEAGEPQTAPSVILRDNHDWRGRSQDLRGCAALQRGDMLFADHLHHTTKLFHALA